MPQSVLTAIYAQAMQRAGLCGAHSPTRLLVLSPCTLGDVLQSILEVGVLAHFHQTSSRKTLCHLSGYVPWQYLPCPDKSPTSNSLACSAMGLQVGAAADVAAEAVRCADALRERLRKTARAVAGGSLRPRVLLLESLRPLTLGECPQQCS